MNQDISYCGLSCQSCPIHLATIETDQSKKDKMIQEIIRLCKTNYGIEYTPEEINACDGCKSGSGRLFHGCSSCIIRPCAMDRGFKSCADCEEYACDRLMVIFEKEPDAQKRLDAVRTRREQT